MDGIIIGVVLMIFAVVFFAVSIYVSTTKRKFQRGKKYSTGVVVDYYREDYTKWDRPRVKMDINGKEEMHWCNSSRMSLRTHPVGTEVALEYFKYKVLGVSVCDVRVVDKDTRPPSVIVLAKVIRLLSLLMLIISIVAISSVLLN